MKGNSIDFLKIPDVQFDCPMCKKSKQIRYSLIRLTTVASSPVYWSGRSGSNHADGFLSPPTPPRLGFDNIYLYIAISQVVWTICIAVIGSPTLLEETSSCCGGATKRKGDDDTSMLTFYVDCSGPRGPWGWLLCQRERERSLYSFIVEACTAIPSVYIACHEYGELDAPRLLCRVRIAPAVSSRP